MSVMWDITQPASPLTPSTTIPVLRRTQHIHNCKKMKKYCLYFISLFLRCGEFNVIPVRCSILKWELRMFSVVIMQSISLSGNMRQDFIWLVLFVYPCEERNYAQRSSVCALQCAWQEAEKTTSFRSTHSHIAFILLVSRYLRDQLRDLSLHIINVGCWFLFINPKRSAMILWYL